MQSASSEWDLKLLYDGECPLCLREVRLLQRLNKRGRLKLEDIAAPSFEPERYGRTLEQLMGHIHAQLPNGELVAGIEVFRRAYEAVGLGLLAAPLGWPVLEPLFARAYEWFARNRLRLTGRADACTKDRCAVHVHK